MTTTTAKSKKGMATSSKNLNDKIKAKLEKNAKVSAKTEKLNKDAILQQVITNRELKWKYPEDCVDTLARKSFRQKNRNKIRQLERALEKADKTQKEKAQKALEKFRKEVLLDIKAEI
jgi:hypothetical protein